VHGICSQLPSPCSKTTYSPQSPAAYFLIPPSGYAISAVVCLLCLLGLPYIYVYDSPTNPSPEDQGGMLNKGGKQCRCWMGRLSAALPFFTKALALSWTRSHLVRFPMTYLSSYRIDRACYTPCNTFAGWLTGSRSKRHNEGVSLAGQTPAG
jgi:hypothetical protein